jgi:hypothetical protein
LPARVHRLRRLPHRRPRAAGRRRRERSLAVAQLPERKPDTPAQIGSYKTPNSSGTKDVNAGDYTIHNPLLVEDEIIASWYTDGVRVIDVSDPTEPEETAHFVPPSANNPVKPSQRGTLTNSVQVWGVAHDPMTKRIYASDMNSGLWILERTGG